MKTRAIIMILAAALYVNDAFAELSTKDMQIAYADEKAKDKEQKNQIAQQLKILNNSIKKIETEIAKNRKKSKAVKSEITKLEKDQKTLETRLDNELANFNQTTTSILRLGQVPSEIVLLQDTLQMQQKRTGALAILKKQLTLDIEHSKKSLEDLTINLEEQKQKKSDLKSIQNRLVAKRLEFRELRKQQKTVLRLPAEIRLKMERDAVMLAQNLNLNRFLNSTKRKTVKTKTSLSKEKLPVKGKIVENYHDKDRITQLPVQGMTIEGFARGKIKALHDGRVIYSGVFREYGHLVILEHQSGAHSLYAGFGKAIVDVGDYLNSGDLMGFLPSEEEPNLYFEVRINNKAQNPKKWLEKDLNVTS